MTVQVCYLYLYAKISQIRCPPASPEGEADGGQAPVIQYVIIRDIERREIFRDNKDRNDMVDRLAILLSTTNTS